MFAGVKLTRIHITDPPVHLRTGFPAVLLMACRIGSFFSRPCAPVHCTPKLGVVFGGSHGDIDWVWTPTLR